MVSDCLNLISKSKLPLSAVSIVYICKTVTENRKGSSSVVKRGAKAMKKESNSKTNSKKGKVSLDALEMIAGGTSHSPAKKEKGLLNKK